MRLAPLSKTGWALALCLLVAACFETAPLTQAAGRSVLPTPGPAQIAVLDGSVTVTGPMGYCVDTEATTESDIEAFVLLVRCRVTMRPAPMLSATVSGVPATLGSSPEVMRRLTTFLTSTAGRAQLSRTGDPSDVRVEQASYDDTTIWLLITDRGNPESFAPTYWRAILQVHGRIVTLSVLSAREHPLETSSGLAILQGFVRRMRAANPES
ncbi:MAG: hypothetical protein R3D60_10380 [Paracoccaceae bacterium]